MLISPTRMSRTDIFVDHEASVLMRKDIYIYMMQPANINTDTKTSKREQRSDDLTAHVRYQPAFLAAGSKDKRARNEHGLPR